MRIFSILFGAILFASFLLAACAKPQDAPIKPKPAESEAVDAQYKKEMEEIKKSLKGDIKVKLKRDAKGAYTWEITGKDAQEVLKTNETLRKRLGEAP
jgi:hypothetical protein